MASIILALNMIIAMYITSKAMKQHFEINMQMAEFERKVDSGSVTPIELINEKAKKS